MITVFLGPLAPGATAASASSGCGCVADYVSPKVSAGTQPVAPSGSSDAYRLVVDPGGVQVTDAKSGSQVLNDRVSGTFNAGFDPTGARLAVWGVDGNQQSWVQLFDLGSKSQQPVWHQEALSGLLALGFSGKGAYLAVVAQSNQSFAKLWAVNSATGAAAFDQQIPVGSGRVFSPDENRLLITTASSGVTHVSLWDLVAGRYSWQGDGAYGSEGAFFSPHGAYFGTATVNGSHVALDVRAAASDGSGSNPTLASADFEAVGSPGSGKDKYGYAGWGFSSDAADSVFAYSAANGATGVTLGMQNLAKKLSPVTFQYPSVTSGFWQFSVCGEMLGIAVQTAPSSGLSVELHPTDYAQGSAAVVQQSYPTLDVHLKTTAAWHVATVNGVDEQLVQSTGCQGAPSGGQGNGSPSSPGAPGNGGGSGSPGGPTVPGGVHVTVPAQLSSFAFDQSVAGAGQSVTGTIALDSGSGDSVALTSSDPAAFPVPSSTMVPYPGAGSFTVQVGSVAQDEVVTVTATLGASTKTTRIAIAAACGTVSAAAPGVASPMAPPVGAPGPGSHTPGNPQLISSLAPDSVLLAGGDTSTATVTMADPTVRDTTVTLTSTDGVVTLPASVVVPRGQQSATFPVSTSQVTEPRFVTISARVASSARAGVLVVLPAPQLSGLQFSPASVTGGHGSTGTVTLPAGSLACGAQIELSSGDVSVSVPTAVPVPRGATSVQFPVTTTAVPTDRNVTVVASLGGSTTEGTLQVRAPAVAGLTNDNFADAAVLSIPGTVTGDTTAATIEPGEQLLTGSCYVLPGFQLEYTVWFTLTPTQTGTLTVSTANPGTSIDSVLALYADPGTSNIGDLGAPVGCDNNGDPDNSGYHTGPGGPMTPTWSSIMKVDVVAGQTYYLQLGGIGGAPRGPFVLTTQMN